MFVKKFVDKVSKKPLSSPRKGLGPEDVNPRLVHHYGIPAGSNSLAYDPIQKILAVSTIDGRIKLFGCGNTQCLLESDEAVPSKFLKFVENQGFLLNITTGNNIQVWDIHKKKLCHVHPYQREITSFTVLQENLYLYIGDQLGNISVLKLEIETSNLTLMQYCIPFSESHGTKIEVVSDTAVISMLPQPKAETSRVLIIFIDGILSLWGLGESKPLFMTGGTSLSIRTQSRKVLSACWICPFGTKVAVGYDNGEIFLWGIANNLQISPTAGLKDSFANLNFPLLKLNLSYKMDKVPIVSLKWITNRLYINGFFDHGSSNSYQVVSLDENTDSRIVKLVLPLPEACKDMEIISSFGEPKKDAHNVLVLLLKSGQLCMYDDSKIEKYLSQCSSKSSPNFPDQSKIKMPFHDSNITIAKFVKENSDQPCLTKEDYEALEQKIPCIFSSDTWGDILVTSKYFSSIVKISSLCITGHQDGSINFWDASCPFLIPLQLIKYQSEDGHPVCETHVKALCFDICSKVLLSGYQNGLVNIFIFQKQPSVADNIFSFLQEKQGFKFNTRSIKLDGAIISLCMSSDHKRFAAGTNKGNVVVIELEGTTVLYQKNFPKDVYQGISSMQFEKVVLNECVKNILLIAMEDTSIMALEELSGLLLSTTAIRYKNPCRALLMETLDIVESLQKQPLLLHCSEKSIRLYCLPQAIQGLKKLYIKKKLHGSCFWASTFFVPSSGYGLILFFHGGKLEIRSLPELDLLKETSVRGIAFSGSKSNPEFVVCSSTDGNIILVKGDQEIFFYSILLQQDTFRHLDSISQVYDGPKVRQAPSPLIVADKERKKGLFSSFVNKGGGKKKQEQAVDAIDSSMDAAELSELFSTTNFSLGITETTGPTEGSKDTELDIDAIDLDDPKAKPKGQNIGTLNKQLGKTFNSFKGKLKARTTKRPDKLENELNENVEANSTVDEIKKKYGYTSAGEQNSAMLARNKLHENLEKLQTINLRTAEMENSARSFSSMAKNLLRSVEKQ